MSLDSWIALAALGGVVAVLIADRYPPALVLGAALAGLVFADVVEPSAALAGFSSTAVATIAALYVVAGAATATGLFSGLVDRALRRDGSVAALCGGTAALSSFIPNTPVIAMAAPQVVRWADRNAVSVSRFLMPMSFASILGGVVTIIGTSTNLVVSDVLVANGEEPLGIFEISPLGLPVAVAGVIVLSTVGRRLLPERSPITTSIERRARQFQIAFVVDADGPLVGRSVEDAGLRELNGAYLSFIERRRSPQVAPRSIAVRPDTVLESGDLCCFVGDASRIVDLHDVDGLRSIADEQIGLTAGADSGVFEAVVAPLSSLVGESLRSVGFRGRFGGAVMAIHREGEELGGQLGRIPLRAGDVLLVLADGGFESRWRDHRDFSLVAGLDQQAPVRRSKAFVVGAIIVAFITIAATGVVSLFEAALAAAIATVAVGAIGVTEARRSIDVNVVLTMAVAIGLGAAISASGLAGEAASVIERVDGLGVHVLAAVTIVSTILLSELLTNTAAAALMVPVGLGVSVDLGLDPRLLAVTVLFGASCSFLSPVGYQTNLMVAGLGGYRFRDFSRVGFPLTLTVVVLVSALAPLIYD